MKKILLLCAALTLVFIFPANAGAKKYSMVFWYPGEQGSTSEAEPVLLELFDYLGKKLQDSTFEGKYFNSTTDGIVYIKKNKPTFGIVSWIALQENNGTLPPFKKIASTLPLPHGSTQDVFALIGNPGKTETGWTPPDNLVVYSSVPVSVAFIKSQMFPDIKGSVSVQNTNTMLMTLKKLASEENKNQVALLTPMEQYTLKNLKTDWAANLKTLMQAKALSTAPLVVFGEEPEITSALVKVLAAMPADADGKEILETLRLKGFKPAN